MCSANTSFYLMTGAEIHWRQATTFTGGGAAAWATLLSGLTGFLVCEAALITASIFASRAIHSFTGGLLHVLAWPFRWIGGRMRPALNPVFRRFHTPTGKGSELPDPRVYEQIALEDDYRDEEEGDYLLDGRENDGPPRPRASSPPSPTRKFTDRPVPRGLILAAFVSFLALRACRPPSPVFMYLSGTLPLQSFFEGSGHRQSPVDATGVPPDRDYLEGFSALHPPPHWDWLPKDLPEGWTDWDREDREALHYDPQRDPLHINNLDKPVLKEIQDKFADESIKVKHIIMVKLESTRADVFPLKKDTYMWDRIGETYKDGKLPEDVAKLMGNLTRTAEYLTGFSNGIEHGDNVFGGKKAYGGISASNAFTSGTYTLKSMTATFCGVTPLVADFNVEWEYHIYQPCMAHVLEMFGKMQDMDQQSGDWTRWPWHSVWMQSVTETYDKQDAQTPVLGYHNKITKETMQQPGSKNYPPSEEEVNYYGYPDTELHDYVEDLIDEVEQNHQRLFLSYLTSTTHHPWNLPHDAYDTMVGSTSGSNNDLNKYLNTIGFVDKWLATVLEILERKGVANETLLVMMGDHGISLPYDGGVTPYDNPHIGCFHVPLILAHPQLPPIEVSAPVTNSQIMPTILDLLIESKSLSRDGLHAGRDILNMYEGQSLLRPLAQEQDGRQDWQFSVMNTGGSWLAVRSAARPELRLIIPLVNDVEWRFSDLSKDPQEKKPISKFSLEDLAEELSSIYEDDVLQWLWDAAYVTNWYVVENWHRYKYDPATAKGE